MSELSYFIDHFLHPHATASKDGRADFAPGGDVVVVGNDEKQLAGIPAQGGDGSVDPVVEDEGRWSPATRSSGEDEVHVGSASA
ncbi:hypothetical protein [Nostocoides australiense]|uniref:hypothetical protein n=1 Tax=Nostocoides australiense TaxID=99480 RepID=UPI0012ECD461|nr:hypothetical protein [Tetrasphaera australiensis]